MDRTDLFSTMVILHFEVISVESDSMQRSRLALFAQKNGLRHSVFGTAFILQSWVGRDHVKRRKVPGVVLP